MKQSAVDPFQSVSDPSRRQMLLLLSRQGLTVNAMVDNFDMTRPAVSKHIKTLYAAGFIYIEDIGRERHCTFNKKGFHDLQPWIDYFDQFWQTRLRKLDDVSSPTGITIFHSVNNFSCISPTVFPALTSIAFFSGSYLMPFIREISMISCTAGSATKFSRQ